MNFAKKKQAEKQARERKAAEEAEARLNLAETNWQRARDAALEQARTEMKMRYWKDIERDSIISTSQAVYEVVDLLAALNHLGMDNLEREREAWNEIVSLPPPLYFRWHQSPLVEEDWRADVEKLEAWAERERLPYIEPGKTCE